MYARSLMILKANFFSSATPNYFFSNIIHIFVVSRESFEEVVRLIASIPISLEHSQKLHPGNFLSGKKILVLRPILCNFSSVDAKFFSHSFLKLIVHFSTFAHIFSKIFFHLRNKQLPLKKCTCTYSEMSKILYLLTPDIFRNHCILEIFSFHWISEKGLNFLT